MGDSDSKVNGNTPYRTIEYVGLRPGEKLYEELRLHSGDKLEFVIVENGKACIRPVTKKVDDVFGRLYKPEKKPVSVEEMDEKIRQKMRAISQLTNFC